MLLPEELAQYAEQHTTSEPPLLAALARETHLRVLQPRMMSGHLQGRLLSLIAQLIVPRYILEIGTFTGYSALCLAEGLHPEGVLHTIDVNEELTDIQQKYFSQSPHFHQIKTHLGQALDIIPTLPSGIDLVFIDADKKNYPAYFDAVIEKMKVGGVILSDNVLWSGKVVEKHLPTDSRTQVLMEYNELLATHPRLQSVLLPLRDGLTISRVIA